MPARAFVSALWCCATAVAWTPLSTFVGVSRPPSPRDAQWSYLAPLLNAPLHILQRSSRESVFLQATQASLGDEASTSARPPGESPAGQQTAAYGAAPPAASGSPLSLGTPLEVWIGGRLRFGAYAGVVAGKQSLRVRLAPDDIDRNAAASPSSSASEAEEAVIDAGQIVAAWDPEDTRDALPASAAEWNRVSEQSRRALMSLPARSLELEGLWKAARGGGKRRTVGSLDAADHLFGPAAKHLQLQQKHQQQQRARTGVESALFRPTCAERMAAARVLAAESARFKRVPSVRVANNSAARLPESAAAAPHGSGAAAAEASVAEVLLTGGGFRALEKAVVASRELGSFCEAVLAAEAARKTSSLKQRPAGRKAVSAAAAAEQAAPALAVMDPAHLLLVHGLELLALGGSAADAGAEACRALEALKRPITPAGARDVLLAAGLWSHGAETAEAAAAVTDAETASGGSGGGGIAGSGVVPWPADVLAAARDLRQRREKRADMYDSAPPETSRESAPETAFETAFETAETAARKTAETAAKTAAKSALPTGRAEAFGRRDFRAERFAVYCLDAAGTRFPDDAVSYDPASGDVLVHVTDVAAAIAEGSVLDEIARLRCHTEYLPAGPLFMLPPAALEALAFSPRLPNEALTVALQIDPATGRLRAARVFASVLPPVRLLTFEAASRHLSDSPQELHRASAASQIAGSGSSGDAAYGEGPELRALQRLAALSAASRRKAASDAGTGGGGSGGSRPAAAAAAAAASAYVTPAHAIVDEFLALYSTELLRFCRAAGAPVPVLMGLAERVESGRGRYATGPLRRYVDLLAQRQAAAAVARKSGFSGRNGPAFVGKRRLAETISYLTWRSNKTRAAATARSKGASWEAFAAHCARQARATGLPHAVLEGRATGRGREVTLAGGVGVRLQPRRRRRQDSGGGGGGGGRAAASAVGSGAFAAGERVRVAVLRVDAARQQVVAEEVEPSQWAPHAP